MTIIFTKTLLDTITVSRDDTPSCTFGTIRDIGDEFSFYPSNLFYDYIKSDELREIVKKLDELNHR